MTVADFLAHLDGVRESGRGWLARCPAHGDRSPSLSVAEGDDARILLRCFAGCSPEAITAALGLRVVDLFNNEPLLDRGHHQRAIPAREAPADLWTAVRLGLRKDRREDLASEETIAGGIFRLHQRAQVIRRAVTALGRDDERALDLLAAAAADEREACSAEAALDELRARRQAIAFTGREA